jgi:2-dehydropantoate 2-reductase
VGGIVAAHLAEGGHDVVAVTTNGAIAEATAAHGLRIRGEGAPRTVRARVVRDVPTGPFDYVVLATQPTDVEAAARSAALSLADDGRMVCLQNGLCEERVAKIAGVGRTLGGVVAWGGAMPEPGLYDRTAKGGFTFGRLDGAEDARIPELARALERIGKTEVTSNLRGKRWSKLAINCAISSLGTLSGVRLGALLRHRFARRLALEIMSEVVSVSKREGVRLEKVSGTLDLDWIALTEAERKGARSPGLAAKHAMLFGVGLRYRRMRSSMLAAIERKRPPAVDFLNGEVVERGRAHGVPSGVNARVRDEVWRLAKGETSPSLANLHRIAASLWP